MARNVDIITTELAKSINYPVELLRFDLSSDGSNALRLTSAPQQIIINTQETELDSTGEAYIPSSNILSFSPIEETRDIKTNAINVELNGVDKSILTALEPDMGHVIGGKVTIFQAFWDEGNGRVVQTPDFSTTILSAVNDGTNTTVTVNNNLPADISNGLTINGNATPYIVTRTGSTTFTYPENTESSDFANTNTVVAIPIQGIYKKWEGIIASFSTTEEHQPQGDIKITVECKNTVTTLLNTKAGRYTSESSFQTVNTNSNTNVYETDTSMEFVPGLIDTNPNFGAEE